MRARSRYYLPVAASLFAIVFALPVLGDTFMVLLAAGTQTLLESGALALYAGTHLVAGAGVLGAGAIGIAAVKKRSEAMLLASELLGAGMFALILALEANSLWALRYLE